MSTELERHGARYQVAADAAVRTVEMGSLGTDYGANGYTTRAQAERIGRLLDLGSDDASPPRLLLDVGSGCGWPGLHLARVHGCSVLCVDPVVEGSSAARARAVADGMDDRALAVVGDGTRLPLPARSVDAIVHSDML